MCARSRLLEQAISSPDSWEERARTLRLAACAVLVLPLPSGESACALSTCLRLLSVRSLPTLKVRMHTKLTDC